MKIRQGFVSNSSSSSFVILYENDTFKSWKDIKGAIERKCDDYNDGIVTSYGRKIDVNDVAKTLMMELDSKIESLNRIDGDEHDNLINAVTEKLTDSVDYNDIIGPDEDWSKWDDFCDSCRDDAIKDTKVLSESHPGKTPIHFEFSDDTPIGCFLEHSDVISDIFDVVSKRSNH